MTLGSRSSLKWCVEQNLKDGSKCCLHLKLPPTGEGQYVLADADSFPDLVSIDPNFSEAVRYFWSSEGGVMDDVMKIVEKHVELIELIACPGRRREENENHSNLSRLNDLTHRMRGGK